jgi:hypothetical protein
VSHQILFQIEKNVLIDSSVQDHKRKEKSTTPAKLDRQADFSNQNLEEENNIKTNLIIEKRLRKEKPTSRAKTKCVEIHLPDNNKNPWGFLVNLSDHFTKWRVEQIIPKQYADCNKLRVGWKLIRYNGLPIDARNYREVTRTLKNGYACTLVFDRLFLFNFLLVSNTSVHA